MSTKHLSQKHVGMIVRELEAAAFDRDTVHRRYCVHRNASISSASTNALPRAKPCIAGTIAFDLVGEHAPAIALATKCNLTTTLC